MKFSNLSRTFSGSPSVSPGIRSLINRWPLTWYTKLPVCAFYGFSTLNDAWYSFGSNGTTKPTFVWSIASLSPCAQKISSKDCPNIGWPAEIDTLNSSEIAVSIYPASCVSISSVAYEISTCSEGCSISTSSRSIFPLGWSLTTINFFSSSSLSYYYS